MIDIWYGKNQLFGHLGCPQHWINVLGRVSNPHNLTLLNYSLNNGQLLPVTIGPNKGRLAGQGDFNIDIDCAKLGEGLNTLRIIAEISSNKRIKETVSIQYKGNRKWPLPYMINWKEISDLQHAAQVVDGLWSLKDDHIRIVEPGYDRLIAIGDRTWESYEITLPVTIHGFDKCGFRYPSNGPGVGILLRWQGHYEWKRDHTFPTWHPLPMIKRFLRQDDWITRQPRCGWFPFGALGWYRWNPHLNGYSLTILGNHGKLIATERITRNLKTGIPYLFKMRVEIRRNKTASYSLKVWENDVQEPQEWDLKGFGVEGELKQGSVLLVAHHTDASFGNINIDPVN